MQEIIRMARIRNQIIELNIDSVKKRFWFNFTICENPECDCNGTIIHLSNEESVIHFFFDFSTESYAQKEYSESEIKTVKAFIGFIKSQEKNTLNLDFLKNNYNYVKEKVRNKRNSLEEFKLGTFLTYRDILWNEKDIQIKINGQEYLVFDGYCVTPNCNCTTVALNFFENIHKLGVREPEFSFVYDYGSNRVIDVRGSNNEEINSIIRTFSSSLNAKFEKRHARLKDEVKQEIMDKIKKKGFKPVDAGRKLGRNEPCHCGSGKKYKKCCLQKDTESYGKPAMVN